MCMRSALASRAPVSRAPVSRAPVSRALVSLALVSPILACGPSVGTTGTGGTGTGGDDSGTSTAAADDTETSAADSSGGTGAGAQWCLRGEPQPALDDGYPQQAITDADGDGRSEVWRLDGYDIPPPEPTSSSLRIYELGDGGSLELVTETTIDGRAFATADIDGDGVLDVLVRQFGVPEPWWQAGQPDLTVSATPRPLVMPDSIGSWVDGTGDGVTDFFESVLDEGGIGAVGVRIHVGDGAGGTTPGDEHDPDLDLLERIEVWPSPIPGQVVIRPVELSLGYPFSAVVALGIDASGVIDVLALSELRDFADPLVVDLDGDGVSDLVARGGQTSDVFVLMARDGAYEEETIDGSAEGMVAGPLLEPEGIDLLLWSSSGEVWLRQRQDASWSEPEPVVVQAEGELEWGRGTPHRIQADGEGGQEILVRSSGETSLWWLEPCQ